MPDLNQIFAAETANATYGAQGIRPPLKKNSSYQIYSLSKFNDLKTLVFQEKQKNKARFRFLVDTQNKLWFAREGTPGSQIPAHYQITGELRIMAQCHAAGTIVIQDDKLVSIDHKSGDFRPSFNSIQYLLRIFAKNQNMPFVINDFTIIELNNAGGQVRSHEIKQAEFETWCADQPAASEQPDEIKEVCYEAETHRRFAASPIRRRGLFDNDSASAQTSRDQSRPRGASLFASDSDSEGDSANQTNQAGLRLFQSNENNDAVTDAADDYSNKRQRFI